MKYRKAPFLAKDARNGAPSCLEGWKKWATRQFVAEFQNGPEIAFFSALMFAALISEQNAFVAFYRRNLPHLQRDYKPHFVTFVTKQRRVLPDWARQIVLDCCTHDHNKKYNLRVVVIMPDHVHMILTPLTDETRQIIFGLPEIMKAIKGASSHAINRQLHSNGAVWQEESFDHVFRSAESLDAKIDYILQNPVRKGLVNISSEYPWSWSKPVESPFMSRPESMNT